MKQAESARIIELRNRLRIAAASLERNARIRDELTALKDGTNAEAIDGMLHLNAQLAGTHEWVLASLSQELKRLINQDDDGIMR